MFKKLLLIASLFVATSALAETKQINADNINLDAVKGIQLCAGTGDIRIGTNCTGGGTTSFVTFSSGGDFVFTTSGAQPSFPTPAPIITPSTAYPTPNAGDTLTKRYSIIAAAAPTATFVELPRATANVGKTYTVVSQTAANPVAIVPQSGDTHGVTAAGTPFSCTAGKSCDCVALTTTNWQCGLR